MTRVQTDPPVRSRHRARRARAAVSAALLLALAVASCAANSTPASSAAQLQFGVDMARRGLWREALFRFNQAERLDPDNPRIYNNLAVAYEATGEFDKALEYYQKALRAAPDNREARGNYARFVEFYQAFRPKEGAADAADNAPAPAATPPAATAEPPVPPPGVQPAPEPPAVDPSPLPPDEPPTTGEPPPPTLP